MQRSIFKELLVVVLSTVIKNTIAKAILIALFPVSFAWAAPNRKVGDNNLANNTKVAIDFSFGTPYGWANSKVTKRMVDIEASPNTSLGIGLGYNFYLYNGIFNSIFNLRPETGLSYGFTRRIKLDKKVTIEEKYLQIPIAITWCGLDDEDLFCRVCGFTLGYEFNVLLSSTYKQEGNACHVGGIFLEESKELKQAIPNVPSPLGSIFFGTVMEFQKGFYLTVNFNVPIELIKVLKDNNNQSSEELFTYAFRALNSSCVRFHLGVDIMRWLYR